MNSLFDNIQLQNKLSHYNFSCEKTASIFTNWHNLLSATAKNEEQLLISKNHQEQKIADLRMSPRNEIENIISKKSFVKNSLQQNHFTKQENQNIKKLEEVMLLKNYFLPIWRWQKSPKNSKIGLVYQIKSFLPRLASKTNSLLLI